MHANPKIHVCDSLRRHIAPATLRALSRRIRRAAARLHIDDEALATLGVRIVDDREMAALHLRFMGESGPTDVLSFAGEFTGEGPSLGDLAIDWQAVQRQAPVKSPAGFLDEATLLAVHGLAHLLGHDHRDAAEGRRMHQQERRVLRALGVADQPRPYARRLLRSPEDREPEPKQEQESAHD
ncbi:MAG: rRNA maturation RNase YbeY [Myxococcales bacterium]|nr:rRNA maturation RNase YbeY [Myxococcales bacterium]